MTPLLSTDLYKIPVLASTKNPAFFLLARLKHPLRLVSSCCSLARSHNFSTFTLISAKVWDNQFSSSINFFSPDDLVITSTLQPTESRSITLYFNSSLNSKFRSQDTSSLSL